MKNLFLPILGDLNLRLNRRGRLGVVVAKFAVREPLGLHPRRMKGDEFFDGSVASRLDVRVGITPQKNPRLH